MYTVVNNIRNIDGWEKNILYFFYAILLSSTNDVFFFFGVVAGLLTNGHYIFPSSP